MESINETAVRNGLFYLDDRGWSELIDPRWTIDVREELERSGLGLTEAEIQEICNVVIAPKPNWQTPNDCLTPGGLHDKNKSMLLSSTTVSLRTHYN